MYGSVRGASGNRRPYRDPFQRPHIVFQSSVALGGYFCQKRN
jgi:hypothetical protein